MMEYWLADRFGRAWLRVHGSLRPLLGDLPLERARVARGETMPAGRLWLAQDFAPLGAAQGMGGGRLPIAAATIAVTQPAITNARHPDAGPRRGRCAARSRAPAPVRLRDHNVLVRGLAEVGAGFPQPRELEPFAQFAERDG